MRMLVDLLIGALVAASLLAVQATPAPAQQPVVPYAQSAAGNPLPVQWHPVLLASLGSTVTQVKPRAGKLAFIYCYNPTAAVAYLQLFDAATAASVTLGTTAPVVSLGIPTLQAAGLGPAVIGLEFINGIQVASTTTPTGNTAASQNCNVAYN